MVRSRLWFEGRGKSGFSLVELLVVVSIMMILLSCVAAFWSFDRSSRQLNAGVRSLQGIARRAHIHSQLLGIPTRLLIERDVRFSDGYLHQIVTVEWVDGEWKLFGAVLTLPEGVFVVAESSGGNRDTGERVAPLSESEVCFSVDLDGRGAREYVYWEFASDGGLDASFQIDFSANDIDAGRLTSSLFLACGYVVNGVLGFDEVDASRSKVGISMGLNGHVDAFY